ncbi:Myoviridae tail sheath stabiliser [uncultured Caudovirales phage]|uniref:Myoviridae tail sheath stabiliser n=1 Tax=uncultured Caudovirales phage TaxID=2100421 RepID=A0A6J7WE18_9CAUD|nr:Myoviridae tail sheath stabiliser [uncultured Caudovirales phage]CAB5209259.1 Myoviridae tail sheath stabiliser [uncultured Caudovirales phage]
MQHFYDGQVRRYITQTIRVLSNFVVKYGDGSLVRVPVMYGDADRQVASIIRNNSENSINSVPRISVYISALDIDHNRLGDSTYVGKLHIRERDIADGQYTQGQGRNYTVERLMPTPFKLTLKCDIWSANTDQKLQILEQILVLFNPSLELQTTDNYVDWTSLSVLNLAGVNWSSRTVPVGADTPIDIATLTLDTPIWISPPVKVKHLGVITSIITSIYQDATADSGNYIDGLGIPIATPDTTLSTLLSKDTVTISDFNIQVYNGQAILLGAHENVLSGEITLEIPIRQGTPINWTDLFNQYPGEYRAGSSTLFLTQPNGTQVIGTFAINPLDDTLLTVDWDKDTLNTNTGIDSSGRFDTDPEYGTGDNYRDASPGTFDAIIDPQTVYPGHGMKDVVAGDRFLIVEDIGAVINQDGADGWKSIGGADLVAKANDIIEWTGSQWNIVFNAAQEADTLIYQTNIYSGVQYVWNGVMWAKSFEGEYKKGQWRIEL